MKKSLLAAVVILVAFGSAFAETPEGPGCGGHKGPGCGNITPPVLGGPGCGGHKGGVKGPGCGSIRLTPVTLAGAKKAVERAQSRAAQALKDIDTVPLEFGGILTLLPYGDEAAPGKDEDIKDYLKGKKAYWELQAAVLNAESKRLADEATEAQESAAFEPALKAAVGSAKIRGLAKTAEAIVHDVECDQEYVANKSAGKGDDAGEVIARKKALFTSLASRK